MGKLINLTLLCLSVVLGLLIAETAFRLFTDPPPYVRVRPRYNDSVTRRDFGELFPSLVISTPRGIRLRPNTIETIEYAPSDGRTIEFATNSLGYRGPELGPKDQSKTRTLFLGDSILFGQEVEESETFVRQIEYMSGGRYETINAGVPGLGLRDEVEVFKESGVSTQPAFVVLIFYLNDDHTSIILAPPQVPDWISWSYLVRRLAVKLFYLSSRDALTNSVPQQTIEQWRREIDGRNLSVSAHRIISDDIIDYGSAWTDDVWRRFRPLVSDFADIARKNSIKPIIVMTPVSPQVTGLLDDWPQTRMKAISAEYGVSFLDLLPLIRKESSTASNSLFYDHCHYTPHGHRVVAEAILPYLEAQKTMRSVQAEEKEVPR